MWGSFMHSGFRRIAFTIGSENLENHSLVSFSLVNSPSKKSKAHLASCLTEESQSTVFLHISAISMLSNFMAWRYWYVVVTVSLSCLEFTRVMLQPKSLFFASWRNCSMDEYPTLILN